MGDQDFDSEKFEHDLSTLKNSQNSIQSLSNWCMRRRAHHKKIVASWLSVLKQVKVEQRLTLFNLANDVIQNSKRKHYEFVSSWGTALQRATTMVRDDKVKQKVSRIFKIWEDRGIYNEDFLADLNGLLNTVTAAKRLSDDHHPHHSSSSSSKTADTSKEALHDLEDFQSSQLVGHINNCVRLQEKTDKAFKLLPKSTDVDVETMKQSGKDREHVEGVQKEVNDSVSKLENYIHSLKAEIKVRNIVIAALGQADEFYRSQRGDVKTVAIAYRNFGLRIKTMKKKLDELTTTLPSPLPSPDINAPSPPPDADIELPEDNSFSSFLNGSTSNSFLGSSQLPFDISDFHSNDDQAIQVISSRDDEQNNGDGGGGYKPVMPPQPVPPVGGGGGGNMYGHQMFSSSSSNHNQSGGGGYNSNSSNSSSFASSGSGGGGGYTPVALVPPPMPPPMINNSSDDYGSSSSWNQHTDAWSGGGGSGVPPPMGMSNKAPASPPFFERKGTASTNAYNEDAMVTPANDVDQRQLNPLLSKIESRLADVDHRNLISLTGSPGGGGGGNGNTGGSGQQQMNNSGLPNLCDQPPPAKRPALLPTPSSMPPPWNNASGGGGDSDFRSNYNMPSQGLVPPPPMPPMMPGYYNGPGNDSFNNFNMGNFNAMTKKSPQMKNGQRDIIETVDMEMSDEEQDNGSMDGGQSASMGNNIHNNNNNNNNAGASFMNFPPPGPPPQQTPPMNPWGMDNNNGMGGPPPNGNNNGGVGNNNNHLHQHPMPMMGGPPRGGGGGFFGPGPPVGGPMFRPPPGTMNNNFRGRGGFGGGGGGGGFPRGAPMNGGAGNGMFRGRGGPFRGGNYRGGRGMW